MPGAIVLAISAALCATYVTWSIILFRRNRRLSRARQNEDVESFVRQFDGSSLSRRVLEMAYADLRRMSSIPPLRSDDLERLHGMTNDDFEDLAGRSCRSLGVTDVLSPPHGLLLPVQTVEDYVRFLSVAAGETNAPSPPTGGASFSR